MGASVMEPANPIAATDYGTAPAVLLFCDGVPAEERARRTAERAGARILACAPVAEARECIAGLAAPAAVHVEVEGDSPGLASLLSELLTRAEGGQKSIVATPPELIDMVSAQAFHQNVQHLCGAGEEERTACLRAAMEPPTARLHDVGRPDAALLQQLAQETGRIASILASLSADEAGVPASAPAETAGEGEEPIDAAFVRALIRARRMRDQFLRRELFADPAWDMLLDLMAARLESRRVAVSSLCIAAAVPATTALRWIKALTDRGIFVRVADPQDGRRVYIELAEESANALVAYLRAVRRIGVAVI